MKLFGNAYEPVPMPVDPNEDFVHEAHKNYPFGMEGIGVRGWIRLVVWTVTEMKKRGLI